MTTLASNPRLDIPFRCSPVLRALYLFVFLLTLFASLFFPAGSFVAKCVAFTLALVGGLLMLRQLRLLSSIECLIVRQGELFISFGGDEKRAKVVANGVVLPSLLTLSLRVDGLSGLPLQLVMFPDAVSPQHHRALRILMTTSRLH